MAEGRMCRRVVNRSGVAHRRRGVAADHGAASTRRVSPVPVLCSVPSPSSQPDSPNLAGNGAELTNIDALASKFICSDDTVSDRQARQKVRDPSIGAKAPSAELDCHGYQTRPTNLRMTGDGPSGKLRV
jgi:hypothetical protein